MGKRALIILLWLPGLCMAQAKPFGAEELVTLSSFSAKAFDNFLEKKGFTIKRRNLIEDQMAFSFYQDLRKEPRDSNAPVVNRRIDVYKKADNWYLILHTSSAEEYLAGRNRLKAMNFFWSGKDANTDLPILFQRQTLTVVASKDSNDQDPGYTFVLQRKELPQPNEVAYAEDLLRFESHEYLVSFFGANNVKKDTYHFSDTESKTCSILFPNTSDQAVFIWEDDANWRHLSYILISGLLSTNEANRYSGSFAQNRWMLKNGIYPGMRIGDLLKLNANDFEFYGKESEYSYMVEPKVTGNINFKWIGVGLNCFNCDRSEIVEHAKVRATDAVRNDLALHVSYIMLKP